MKGFSLIELMTVVAIIAILMAVGIPTYQDYLLQGKMASARVYLDSFNGLVTDYYSDHGAFPNNTDLGVSSTIPTSPAEYLYAPYVAYITMTPQTTTGTQCPYTINTAYFSNYQGDFFSNGTSNYVVLNNFFIDNQGTMVKMCSFYEYSPATSQATTNYIFPDCVLDTSSSPANIMSFINTACS